MKRYLFLLIPAVFLYPALAPAASPAPHRHHHPDRPDIPPPIGVMGGHTHPAGELMLSYRCMFMHMDGQRDGTRDRSSADVFSRGYPVAPTEMDMEMHMFGLMYAPSDTVTLMLMASYIEMEMDHVTRPATPPAMMRGPAFTTESSDWGDTGLSALVKVYNDSRQHIHLNLGISLPTGSIDEQDPTPLPFPMQTGSGTYDLKPGLTYLGHSDHASWGAQVLGTIRLDENKHGYTLGDGLGSTGWAAYPLCRWASLSFRLTWEWMDSIHGENRKVPRRPAPTADPDHHGGHCVEAGAGLNLFMPNGAFKGHRIAIEGLYPVYQNLNGPQLERESRWTVGWQKPF